MAPSWFLHRALPVRCPCVQVLPLRRACQEQADMLVPMVAKLNREVRRQHLPAKHSRVRRDRGRCRITLPWCVVQALSQFRRSPFGCYTLLVFQSEFRPRPAG